MKLKFNNFNPEEQGNTISNNETAELNNLNESQYESYAPSNQFAQPEIVQSKPSQVETKIDDSDNLFKAAMRSNYIDTSITDTIVNDNTSDVIKEKVTGLLDSKSIRQYARNDLKYKPVLALFLNYFTIVLSFSIIGVMLVAFFGTTKISMMACGIISILLSILLIMVLPDFIKIFLDLRRNNTPSKLLSNKGKILPLFVVLFMKALIFTLILLLFPVIGVFVTKLISNSIIKLILYSILFIIAIVLIILIAIKYSLAEMICVDGTGPIQSLKSSRKLLKNNTIRYIKSILPILGWSLLASAIIGILCSLPMMIIGLNQGFNLMAGIMLLFSIFIVECIFMFPIYSYYFMIKAEFYDNAIHKEMNVLQNKRKKLPIILILSVSLILILISSFILYMLPADISSTELLNKLTTNTTMTNEETEETYALGLYFSLPTSYITVDQSDTTVFYAKDQKYALQIEMMEGETDFEEEIEAYNATEETIGTWYGYKYTMSGSSENAATKYGFSFMYNDCKYSVVGDVEQDVYNLVKSIKEVGTMEFE